MTDVHDPFDLRRLQPRACDVFARAARMQDLHAQAQAQILGKAPASPEATVSGNRTPPASADPQRVLAHNAGQALVDTHQALQAAARQAHQMALADPVMARLNARINGQAVLAPPGEVIDVDMAEVQPAAAGPAQPIEVTAPPPLQLAPPGAD